MVSLFLFSCITYFQEANKWFAVNGIFPNNRIANGFIDTVAPKKKPFIQWQEGAVSYEYSFQQNSDSIYNTGHFSQHIFSSSWHLTVANELPLLVTYRGRRSNSPFLPGRNDFTVNIDAAAIWEKGAPAMRSPFYKNLLMRIRDSSSRLKALMDTLHLTEGREKLTGQELTNNLLEARKQLSDLDFFDSLSRDSIRTHALQVIEQWEQFQKEKDSLGIQSGKLQTRGQQLEEDWALATALMNSSMANKDQTGLAPLAKRYGMEMPSVPANFFTSIQKVSIGRSYPDFTPLTIKDQPVRGVNVEYLKGHLYGAFAAGAVDNFFDLLKGSLPKQKLVALRLGWNSKQGTRFIATWFSGRKQLSAFVSNSLRAVEGISVDFSFIPIKGWIIESELAQAFPLSRQKDTSLTTSQFLNKDRAFAASLRGSLPSWKLSLEASYQYHGSSYHCFTFFREGVNNEGWQVKLAKTGFHNKLRLTAELRKNEVNNPQLLQRYNASTVYKSLTAAFHKNRWPSISVGYQPASQLVVVDQQIYQTYFQSLNLSVTHHYKWEALNASTALIMNRYFNTTMDSGFLFANTINLAGTQSLFFNSFSAHAGFSSTRNEKYQWQSLEAGASIPLNRMNSLEAGIRIHALPGFPAHAGYYTNFIFSLPKAGVITIRYDMNYLPDTKGTLARSTIGTVAFQRTFK